jgi:RNA polymerase sigma-70 factor (ECF subfamily)
VAEPAFMILDPPSVATFEPFRRRDEGATPGDVSSVREPDVAAAAAGDGAAYERLYRLHLARIHGLARRMMGPADAEEMTQEVFVRAWTKLASFRGDSAFGTWLHRLAVNLILERRESRNLRQSRLTGDETAFHRLSGPRTRTDLAMDLDQAIDRLPDGARQVFVLHDVEGYKHREIATLLGTATGTSKAQLHRARLLLRRFLRPK